MVARYVGAWRERVVKENPYIPSFVKCPHLKISNSVFALKFFRFPDKLASTGLASYTKPQLHTDMIPRSIRNTRESGRHEYKESCHVADKLKCPDGFFFLCRTELITTAEVGVVSYCVYIPPSRQR